MMFQGIFSKIKIYLVLIIVLVVIDWYTAPVTTETMAIRATETAQNQDIEIPLQTFTQDGCTLFPEKILKNDWSEACLEHDIAYWIGGTDKERKAADTKLSKDVASSGVIGSFVAPLMYFNVRIAGDSWLTRAFNAHWGYGQD